MQNHPSPPFDVRFLLDRDQPFGTLVCAGPGKARSFFRWNTLNDVIGVGELSTEADSLFDKNAAQGRLAEGGWIFREFGDIVDDIDACYTVDENVWEKTSPKHPAKLVLQPNGSVFLADLRSPFRILLTEQGSADWDHQGRLVYTKEGRLYAGNIPSEFDLEEIELADFQLLTREGA